MKRAIAVAVAVAALSGCTVYQPAPLVVEHHDAPSAYWAVIHEQTQANLQRQARRDTEEELRRQQWTDAEIRSWQMSDYARLLQAAVRSVP